jgi:hypothetical protein
LGVGFGGLVGTAGSVGIVACLPIAGPVGAVTLLGGVGGGWVGWLTSSSKERERRARCEGAELSIMHYRALRIVPHSICAQTLNLHVDFFPYILITYISKSTRPCVRRRGVNHEPEKAMPEG